MNKRLLKSIPIILALAMILILARPTRFSIIFGAIIVLAGEAIRVWASGHLIRNDEVTTSGPYAYLRDPFYLGRLLLMIGFCAMAWGYNWIILIIGLGVFFFNYMPRKYRKEMERLENIFGQEYRDYASYTRGLIPRLRPYPKARKRPWRFDLFWKENREQYFLCGAILFFLLIIIRYFYI
jgi:protein-S-isoprenylcysteine O-methyltransferase Ste14